MVEYSRNRCNYPQVPTERILKNFKQLSHKNDSISQMASWLSFYRSSEETLCYLFSEAFVDSTLNKEERLAIFYVFHELVTRSITVDEESRRFFMAGYEQFLLSAAPIIGRLDLKSKSYYLQVVRLWQQSTKFPQEVCERLRLLFNSGSGSQDSQRGQTILDRKDKKIASDLVRSLNKVREGYKLLSDAEEQDTSQEKPLTLDMNGTKLKSRIEQYKESLDLVTDATIILSQCLQSELECFGEFRRNLEESFGTGANELSSQQSAPDAT